MSPDEARLAGQRLAEWSCAAQGIPVELDDPALIARVVGWLGAAPPEEGGGAGG